MAQVTYDADGKPQTVVLEYQEFVDLSRRADRFEHLEAKLDRIVETLQGTAGKGAGSHGMAMTVLPGPEALPAGVTPPTAAAMPASIRTFGGARGYYTGYKRFCVLQGSHASGRTAPSFDGKHHLVHLRKSLLRDGILAPGQNAGTLVFTRDWEFHSSSAAACVIAGSSRSGPDAWGRPSTAIPFAAQISPPCEVQVDAPEDGNIKI